MDWTHISSQPGPLHHLPGRGEHVHGPEDHEHSDAAQGPDVTRAAITIASEDLGRHESDGALELALELTRNLKQRMGDTPHFV